MYSMIALFLHELLHLLNFLAYTCIFIFFIRLVLAKTRQNKKNIIKKPKKKRIYKREGEYYKDEARFFLADEVHFLLKEKAPLSISIK